MNRMQLELCSAICLLTLAMPVFSQSTAIKLTNSDPNLPNQLLPMGMNNRGDIVGHIGDERDGVGFIITSGGQQQTFVFPGQCEPLHAPGMCTNPQAINDSGEVVGQAILNGGAVAFFRDKKGVMTALPLAPDGSTLSPGSINARGAIAGSFGVGTHGFVLFNGNFTTIDFPGATITACTGINNSGLVTGDYRDSTGFHGFLWDKGNFIATFQISVNNVPVDTFPTGINDRGQVAIPAINALNPSPTAFVRNTDGTMTTIDLSSILQPIGGIAGALTGINNRGDLVGFFSPTPFDIFGFLIPQGAPKP